MSVMSQQGIGSSSPTVKRSVIQRGIGVYVRKSTDKQGDLSLPAQERLIRAAIVDPSGQSVYRVYRDVLSGTRSDRAEYQQMLTDARAGRLTMVAFHKVNRFGRDAAEGLAAINELRRLGVEVRVADIPSLDIRKPEGMFVFSFLLIQGQYEVENLGNEAIKGMQELVHRGGWPFVAPDGYINCREQIGGHQRCWIARDRPRAAIIRLMFRWYMTETTTLRSIAERLNTLHETRVARGRRGCLTRRGKQWTVQTVCRLLHNPFYAGRIIIPAWNMQVRGAHTPLVSEQQFQQVQAILRSHFDAPLDRHTYLLQGRVLLIRPNQGSMLLSCSTASQRNRRYYYWYEGKKRRHLPAKPIDRTVVEFIQRRVSPLNAIPQQEIARRMHRAITQAYQAVETRIAELEEQRKRVLYQATTGRFSDAEIAGELNRLAGVRIELDREAAHIHDLRDREVQIIALWEDVTRTMMSWHERSDVEQQALVRQLVDQVEVDMEGTIQRITWSPLWDQFLFTVDEEKSTELNSDL